MCYLLHTNGAEKITTVYRTYVSSREKMGVGEGEQQVALQISLSGKTGNGKMSSQDSALSCSQL